MLPAFDTPAGKLGVLICADAWFPQAYAQLKAQGIEWLAVAAGAQYWDEPWRGYNVEPAPQDIDPHDVDSLLEGQAWHKYAMAGRISQAGASCGVMVFLHGKLWDYGALGGHAMLVNKTAVVDARADGAVLLNLWLS
jgi:predicted amidohydrolase